MEIRRATLILLAGIITASCSEKSAPERDKHLNTSEGPLESRSEATKGEEERRPGEDAIAEDCVAFVRSTKVVSVPTPTADCPGCSAGGTEALTFRQMKIERISSSSDTSTVLVTIRASFNPGSGERITGGLTAWISPEQRGTYLSGHTPTDEQAYRVRITYKRRGEAWRAIEFDRPSAE